MLRSLCMRALGRYYAPHKYAELRPCHTHITCACLSHATPVLRAQNGHTALMLAAVSKQFDTLSELIERNGVVNSQNQVR